MKDLLEEIKQIPVKALACFARNAPLALPKNVPYVGMGSSYYAAQVAAGAGAKIRPYLASEYYSYAGRRKLARGVLISQSGQTSEVLWCAKRFNKIIAITNNGSSQLAKSKNIAKLILLNAGAERSSSTKTFINTLAILYSGLGLQVGPALKTLQKNFSVLKKRAEQEAQKIFKYFKKNKAAGLYVLGSGPNWGAACEAALALAEVTKLPWQGMELSMYDHGPKETAQNSVVVFLDGGGGDRKRAALIAKILKSKSNALTLTLSEHSVSEKFSPFSLVTQSYFLTNRLADLLHIKRTYRLGGKVTRAPKPK